VSEPVAKTAPHGPELRAAEANARRAKRNSILRGKNQKVDHVRCHDITRTLPRCWCSPTRSRRSHTKKKYKKKAQLPSWAKSDVVSASRRTRTTDDTAGRARNSERKKLEGKKKSIGASSRDSALRRAPHLGSTLAAQSLVPYKEEHTPCCFQRSALLFVLTQESRARCTLRLASPLVRARWLSPCVLCQMLTCGPRRLRRDSDGNSKMWSALAVPCAKGSEE
jgi:hypothetical protein